MAFKQALLLLFLAAACCETLASYQQDVARKLLAPKAPGETTGVRWVHGCRLVPSTPHMLLSPLLLVFAVQGVICHWQSGKYNIQVAQGANSWTGGPTR